MCYHIHTTGCSVNLSYAVTLNFLTSKLFPATLISCETTHTWTVVFYWEWSYPATYQSKHLLLFSNTLRLGTYMTTDRFEITVLEPISVWQPQCRCLLIYGCWILITTEVWEQLSATSLITRMNRKALIAFSCALCFLLEWLKTTRKYGKG